MSISLKMSPNAERALSEQAAERGITAEEYAGQIVAQRVAQKQPGKRKLTGYGSMAHLDRVTVDSYLANKADERALEGDECHLDRSGEVCSR